LPASLKWIQWATFQAKVIYYNNPIAKEISRYLGNDSVSAYGKFVSGIDKRILDRRERGKVERRDMLQYFFEAKTDAGLPLPYEDILSECRNVIGAGADTISIGIKAVLGKTPRRASTSH
jgi:cytochrome P450